MSSLNSALRALIGEFNDGCQRDLLLSKVWAIDYEEECMLPAGNRIELHGPSSHDTEIQRLLTLACRGIDTKESVERKSRNNYPIRLSSDRPGSKRFRFMLLAAVF
jgi:hypothetical protein